LGNIKYNSKNHILDVAAIEMVAFESGNCNNNSKEE